MQTTYRSHIIAWTLTLVVVGCILSCTKSPDQPTHSLESNIKSKSVESIPVDELLGKIDPTTHPDFAAVPRALGDRDGLYLRKETLEAYLKMQKAAAEAGHIMIMKSSTRTFDHQKRIWRGQWVGDRLVNGQRLDTMALTDYQKAKRILGWSSMPGTSRHHWGTDVDVNAFSNSYFEEGEGLALYSWMKEHAADYGFCQVYTSKEGGRTGYNEEKWHWSYRPLADKFTRTIKDVMSPDMIEGFVGHQYADTLRVIEDYMLGIDPGCI